MDQLFHRCTFIIFTQSPSTMINFARFGASWNFHRDIHRSLSIANHSQTVTCTSYPTNGDFLGVDRVSQTNCLPPGAILMQNNATAHSACWRHGYCVDILLRHLKRHLRGYWSQKRGSGCGECKNPTQIHAKIKKMHLCTLGLCLKLMFLRYKNDWHLSFQ